DFVLLPGGRITQLSHTLTGMETFCFPRAPGGVPIFSYPQSAATWAGDLGQAVYNAVEKLKDEVAAGNAPAPYAELLTNAPAMVDAVWAEKREDKAREVELHGDVFG